MTNESAIPRHCKWCLRLKLFHFLHHLAASPPMLHGQWGLRQREEGDASCRQSCRKPPHGGASVVSHGRTAAGALLELPRAQGTALRWCGSSLISPQLSVCHLKAPYPEQHWVTVPCMEQCFVLC